MSLPPGTRLGPYEILAPIGAGGMGEVYRASDTRLGREVAIKVVSAKFGSRFQTEARAIAALNHPNICTLHDVGPDYLVMELVEGETLAARLKRGPLGEAETLRLSAAIADALAAAHAKNMAHRDLKPGNVMITPDGRVKLLDFGLAKMLENSDPDATRTVDGAVLGTFAYMSPEQLQGQPAGPSSDIFTFGAVLYEMLSGRRAFQTAALREDPPAPAGASPELAAIVARCLRRAPEERYARMSEVKAALERAAASAAPSPEQPPPSIAVLPFANMSGDKDNEYFSDGLAEEILNALTRVEGLKVTARTSAFSFRGKDVDIRKVGEALSVRTVLEGSVRRAGNRIRVTAQLINVADGYHLWSQRYDRDMTDVFAVQDEISAAIVEALKLKLAPSRPPPRRPADQDAYHAYLRGRYHLAKLSPEDYARARAHFETAIALDPGYAPAHAMLAVCLFASAQTGAMPVREMAPLARDAALQALERDASLPEAHGILAIIAATFDYDWREAEARFRLAQDTEDGYLLVACCGMVLAPLGRFEEMIALAEKAIAADPLSAPPRNALAMGLICTGSYQRAVDELLRLLEIQGTNPMGYVALATTYLLQGKTQDAIACAERGVALMPWFPALLAVLACAYQRAGDQSKADALAMRLASMGAHEIVDVSRGFYHLMCSEFERAADWFERALEARHFAVTQLAWQPLAEEFRKTPRGRELLARMNLGGAPAVQ